MSVSVANRSVDGEALAIGALVVTTELLLVLGYVVALDVTVTDWTLFAVPFVWINVAALAVLRAEPAAAPARKRALAAGIAGGYFLLLAYFGGLIGPGSAAVSSLSVELLGIPPGWSPAVLYNGSLVSLALLPYKVIGYLALAYLVYATALDAASALVGGVVGLFSCVSCSFPLLAGVATGLVGGGGALAAATSEYTYLLSTVVFVLTVLLLAWRPRIAAAVRTARS